MPETLKQLVEKNGLANTLLELQVIAANKITPNNVGCKLAQETFSPAYQLCYDIERLRNV